MGDKPNTTVSSKSSKQRKWKKGKRNGKQSIEG